MSDEFEQLRESFETLKRESLALLLDDTSSEARAVLLAPAERCDPELVNRITKISGGLFFVAVSHTRADELLIPPMPEPAGMLLNSELRASTVSVEAREGITTGISAADRSATLKVLGSSAPNPRKLVTPGHIFPIVARAGGTLVRSAPIEAAIDIMRIANFQPAALCVQLLAKNGEAVHEDEINECISTHQLPVIRLSELIHYLLKFEPLVERVGEAKLPTHLGGEFRSRVYRSALHEGEHFVLVRGEIDPQKPVLTRVHRENPLEDIFFAKRSAPRRIVDLSLEALQKEESAIFLYLRRSANKKEDVMPRRSLMLREYGIGAQILRDLGAQKIRLLTNSQQKLVGLDVFGIEIESTQPFT